MQVTIAQAPPYPAGGDIVVVNGVRRVRPRPYPGYNIGTPIGIGPEVVGYQISQGQAGCCNCATLSPIGWLAVLIMVCFFWPGAFIICCIDSFHIREQHPIMGSPEQLPLESAPSVYATAPPVQGVPVQGGYPGYGPPQPGYAPPPPGYAPPPQGYAPPPPAYAPAPPAYAAPPPKDFPPGHEAGPQGGYPVPQAAAPPPGASYPSVPVNEAEKDPKYPQA